jgi:hypothetical protein
MDSSGDRLGLESGRKSVRLVLRCDTCVFTSHDGIGIPHVLRHVPKGWEVSCLMLMCHAARGRDCLQGFNDCVQGLT